PKTCALQRRRTKRRAWSALAFHDVRRLAPGQFAHFADDASGAQRRRRHFSLDAAFLTPGEVDACRQMTIGAAGDRHWKPSSRRVDLASRFVANPACPLTCFPVPILCLIALWRSPVATA